MENIALHCLGGKALTEGNAEGPVWVRTSLRWMLNFLGGSGKDCTTVMPFDCNEMPVCLYT